MMSTCPTKINGAFSWNELMTSDVEGAKTFYGELLGWKMVEMAGCETGYTMAKAGDKEIAGIMATPPDNPMPPTWGAYITVDDVDARAAQVEALGGRILLAAQDIPNVGRFVVIQDPQGAMVSLITYNKE
jgi:predicted enzyme related to lactoylglutathione lyase